MAYACMQAPRAASTASFIGFIPDSYFKHYLVEVLTYLSIAGLFYVLIVIFRPPE